MPSGVKHSEKNQKLYARCEKGFGQKGPTSLSLRYVYIILHNHGHMTLVDVITRSSYIHTCARPMHTAWKWRLICTPQLSIFIAFQPDTLVQPY